jgi:hypothetical protein
MEWNSGYIATVMGLVGTTVAPWMQFYMQSSVIEKGLKISNYRYTLWDVVLGCIATIVVAFFIIVACAATLHANGITINEASDAAMALKPLAGALAGQLFAPPFYRLQRHFMSAKHSDSKPVSTKNSAKRPNFILSLPSSFLSVRELFLFRTRL